MEIMVMKIWLFAKRTFMTFWLFIHPNGSWAKGEGATDEEAVAKAMSLMAHRP